MQNGVMSQNLATKHLIKTGLISLFIIILAYTVNYLINVMLARWLGGIIYGNYAAGTNALRVTAVFMLMGMDYAVIRFIPEYLSTSNWPAAAGYLRHNFALLSRIGFGVFLLGLLVGVGLYVLGIKEVILFEQAHPFFLFLWATPLVALNTYFGKLLVGTRNIYLSLLTLNVAQPFTLFLILSIFVLTGYHINIYEAMFAFIASTLVVLIWQTLATYFALPQQIVRSEPYYEPKWTNIAIQLLVASFLMSNFNSMLIIISEIFDPQEKHTGILFAMSIVCNSLWLLASGIKIVMSPLIAPVVQAANLKKLQELINIAVMMLFGTGLAILFIIFWYGKIILRHFGPVFVLGYRPMLILAVALVFTLLNGMSDTILQYSGHQRIVIRISLTCTIALIILGSFLCHFYGLMGSVIAASIVQIMYSATCSYYVRKLFKIKPIIFF